MDSEIISSLDVGETIRIIRQFMGDQPFSTTGTPRGILLSSPNADVSLIQAAVDLAAQKRDLRGNVPNVDQSKFFSMSPADIDNWIDANVNTLQDAKGFLKKLAKVVLLILREHGAA